jgi:NAD(P)-dependent dehydrogenase (short-subunit alcohol dehydrogenase family)
LLCFDGKVVFVSGGSQGLGAAIARAAVREGAQAVVVTGRRCDTKTIQKAWR